MLTPRFVHSIYCDDVRMEVGNKVTYAGIYTAGMEIEMIEGPTLPFILPKLCVVITFQTPKTDPVSTLKFQFLKNETVLQELTIPQKTLEEANAHEDPEAKFCVFGAMVTLQGLPITESGNLRVVAVTDRESLLAGALKIKLTYPSASL